MPLPTPPRGTHPPGRPRHTARRGSWAQRASSAPSPSEGLPPAVGGQGRAGLRPLRPRSQTPELPAARRRVRGQLASCWFRLLELGDCAAAVTESGGPWDECAWALRQPLRSVAGCRPLGAWVAGSPPASPASPICKSPAPRPPGPPRSSRPSEWRRRRDLCKGFRQRQGRGPEAVSKPTGMGREEDQQRQVEELLFSFEKPNDGKICF